MAQHRREHHSTVTHGTEQRTTEEPGTVQPCTPSTKPDVLHTPGSPADLEALGGFKYSSVFSPPSVPKQPTQLQLHFTSVTSGQEGKTIPLDRISETRLSVALGEKKRDYRYRPVGSDGGNGSLVNVVTANARGGGGGIACL